MSGLGTETSRGQLLGSENPVQKPYTPGSITVSSNEPLGDIQRPCSFVSLSSNTDFGKFHTPVDADGEEHRLKKHQTFASRAGCSDMSFVF